MVARLSELFLAKDALTLDGQTLLPRLDQWQKGQPTSQAAVAYRLALLAIALDPSSGIAQNAAGRALAAYESSDQAAIDRLQRALATDERIVMLREQVERSAQVRLQEGVVTASEYLDRNTELLQARFARAGHEVELAQASARFLTALGLEVR